MGNLRTQAGPQQIKVSLLNVLGFPANAPAPEFFRAFGELLELPAVAAAAVSQHADPDHHDLQLYLSWTGPITTALRSAEALHTSTQTVVNNYNDTHVDTLRFCGSLLSAAAVEGRVHAEDLQRLRNLVTELEEAITDAEIPSDLKSLLTRQLDRIRYALREFNIRGPAALADITEQMIGSFIQHSSVLQDANEESQSLLEKFGEAVDLADRIGKAGVSVGKGIAALTGAGAVLLAVLHGTPLPTGTPQLPPVVVQTDDTAGSRVPELPSPADAAVPGAPTG
jgi:hypothetical protein